MIILYGMGKSPVAVIDAHAHCGVIDRSMPQSFEDYEQQVAGMDIGRAALDEIRRRNLPVVLEEEFDNTLRFVKELADGVTVIIPHLGLLNGGFRAVAEAGLWDRENVWADTALASQDEIREYLRRYGHRRLLFGSDFPFGSPSAELHKVRSLGLDPEVEAAVLGGNFIRLQV